MASALTAFPEDGDFAGYGTTGFVSNLTATAD